jgi:(p)ppGpp synthase/HD superfamily hydrolase
MLRDITKIISDSKVNIETITNHHSGKVSIIDVTLGLEEISQASSVIKKLKEVKDVEGVKRTQKMPLENK